eukprot:TRINITY_DN16002_c0_g1_i1.p1 TRINITY_DN16002_c0_g1~~TRINITY_DN16002_c0_g1_i1.p1  ORF type:complete len:193 (-),score=34.76 TRINITY_DN16002_c0_g1_i1:309-851(-)
MRNAFADLAEVAYGPHCVHNVAFLSEDGALASVAEAWLRHLRGERRLGTASLGWSSVNEPSSELTDAMEEAGASFDGIETLALDELDALDFDTAVVLTQEDGSVEREQQDAVKVSALPAPVQATDWDAREARYVWRLPRPHAADTSHMDVAGAIKGRVEALLASFDELAMKRACGAGTSC